MTREEWEIKCWALEKEIAELKQKLESDELALNEANEIIAELKAQIEKMKCCGNCKHINEEWFFCDECKHIEIPNHNYIDKWELAE